MILLVDAGKRWKQMKDVWKRNAKTPRTFLSLIDCVFALFLSFISGLSISSSSSRARATVRPGKGKKRNYQPGLTSGYTRFPLPFHSQAPSFFSLDRSRARKVERERRCWKKVGSGCKQERKLMPDPSLVEEDRDGWR